MKSKGWPVNELRSLQSFQYSLQLRILIYKNVFENATGQSGIMHIRQ